MMRVYNKVRQIFVRPTWQVTGGVIVALLLVGTGCMALAKETMPDRIEINPPPKVIPPTMPTNALPGGGSPFSVDTHGNTADYMHYEPYNTFPRELDLWNLEGKRLIRSPVVVNPAKTGFVYSEILFVPFSRQTIAKLYWVPLTPLPAEPQPRLPSEEATNPPPKPVDPSVYAARFDPARTTSIRKSLVDVGFSKVRKFDFRTLTVTDWSATGKRLLFKERSGVLHLGLRTTNILIYDETQGTVTIYPEVQRIIRHYWEENSNLPNLDRLAWEIQPLGWEPSSDEIVLLKAWAYDKQEKKFLGIWSYDAVAERTQLVSLTDEAVPVGANGWLATPLPPPPVADEKPGFKERISHPFGYKH